MNNTQHTYLDNLPNLGGYQDEFLRKIASKSELLTFKKGELILRIGEPNRWIGIIAHGLVRAYEQMDNQEENFWAFFKENQCCACPFALQNEAFSKTNLEALEDTTLIAINVQDFDRIRLESPAFEANFLRGVSNQMTLLMKEKSLLLNMTAIERYDYFLNNYPEMIQRLSLGHISTFLGIRQSSLSRIRRQMSRGHGVE